MNRPFGPIALTRLLICLPFFVMLFLMLVEAMLSATTTYLVIETGRDVANGTFRLADLMWILAAQSAAYVVGAVSWIFAERAGFLAYGRYMLRFARDNRTKTKLLGDKDARERVEPFLTGETFYIYFHLLYEMEGDLRILLALVLNVIVIGGEIDSSLPIAYAAVFVVLILIQWTCETGRARLPRKPAHDQPHDRAGLHGVGQRVRRQPLQPPALAWRLQGQAARRARGPDLGDHDAGGPERGERDHRPRHRLRGDGVAVRNAGNMEVLITLAATLPRQIDMTDDIHTFTSGWNDMVAGWARMTGVADNMHPEPDEGFDARIKYDRLMLREGGKHRAPPRSMKRSR